MGYKSYALMSIILIILLFNPMHEHLIVFGVVVLFFVVYDLISYFSKKKQKQDKSEL